ncbi:hypothetical protein [Methylobacterium pseudosasicola]|uniref:hypothetical protein n=1 Tax=Methylobacterium pseudosasicola TaxID=582667 RepID=UPI0011141C5E|nr:hypothetical protein [Methylobacterium pseudosasicola]
MLQTSAAALAPAQSIIGRETITVGVLHVVATIGGTRPAPDPMHRIPTSTFNSRPIRIDRPWVELAPWSGTVNRAPSTAGASSKQGPRRNEPQPLPDQASA